MDARAAILLATVGSLRGEEVLPGAAKLTAGGDLSERMIAGIERSPDRATAVDLAAFARPAAADRRGGRWRRRVDRARRGGARSAHRGGSGERTPSLPGTTRRPARFRRGAVKSKFLAVARIDRTKNAPFPVSRRFFTLLLGRGIK